MDEGKIISLRMGTEDIQTMDDFLEGHPELGGRSLFIRTAVRQYIASDGDVPAPAASKNEVTVKLPSAVLETIDSLVDDGIYTDRADAIRTMLRQKIVNETTVEELAQTKFNAASMLR